MRYQLKFDSVLKVRHMLPQLRFQIRQFSNINGILYTLALYYPLLPYLPILRCYSSSKYGSVTWDQTGDVALPLVNGGTGGTRVNVALAKAPLHMFGLAIGAASGHWSSRGELVVVMTNLVLILVESCGPGGKASSGPDGVAAAIYPFA
ncbi:hypothetical protein BC937DRAFT_95078 [Endogone sp. FLAS-F59071]|nr:hypothetical protein BC937DRAFT_95078 [Endogone sp. FLAS-F59071]|eukprot:RUS13598.1 hypothetical protein BC937DRAFT_95078 [Endogone sp. FLAS-F59071]